VLHGSPASKSEQLVTIKNGVLCCSPHPQVIPKPAKLAFGDVTLDAAGDIWYVNDCAIYKVTPSSSGPATSRLIAGIPGLCLATDFSVLPAQPTSFAFMPTSFVVSPSRKQVGKSCGSC
jgi:hypothetical protein